jgi:hypothetical protein
MVVRFRLANWLVYPLAGYPHLMFGLWRSLPALASEFGIANDSWTRLTLVYGLILGFGLLLGLAHGLPCWSGSWIGFNLLFGLELLVGWFPRGGLAWGAGLLWLAAAFFILTLLARRDRLTAVLAALPIAPMFVWSLALNRSPDMAVQVLLLMAAGFGLGVLSVAIAHLGKSWLAAPLVIVTIGGFSLLISFAVNAGQILPIQPASLGGLLFWIVSELAFLGTVALFTAPAWLSWLVEQFRP